MQNDAATQVAKSKQVSSKRFDSEFSMKVTNPVREVRPVLPVQPALFSFKQSSDKTNKQCLAEKYFELNDLYVKNMELFKFHICLATGKCRNKSIFKILCSRLAARCPDHFSSGP